MAGHALLSLILLGFVAARGRWQKHRRPSRAAQAQLKAHITSEGIPLMGANPRAQPKAYPQGRLCRVTWHQTRLCVSNRGMEGNIGKNHPGCHRPSPMAKLSYVRGASDHRIEKGGVLRAIKTPTLLTKG